MVSVSWNIGKIVIKGNLVLAPMTRVTDYPFRMLCRRCGASLAYTEMVNVNAVSRGNKAARMNSFTASGDEPLGIQLFGSQPEKFCSTARAIVESLQSTRGVFLDVNLDCPDEAIINQGAGAALLKRPERITAIIAALNAAQLLPVTAKMRLTSGDEALAVKTAKIIEAAGASALTVHARTIAQKNSGDAQWSTIKAIKEAVSIPVIGNGGINSPEAVSTLLRYTCCDAAMIGKAVLYNPSVFSEQSPGAKRWDPPTLQKRLEWTQSYFTIAIQNNCAKHQRLEQRAVDFFKDCIPATTITKIFTATKDIPSILNELTKRVTQLSIP